MTNAKQHAPRYEVSKYSTFIHSFMYSFISNHVTDVCDIKSLNTIVRYMINIIIKDNVAKRK